MIVKKTLLTITLLMLALVFSFGRTLAQEKPAPDDFKLCMKSYSYMVLDPKIDFFQAVDKTAALGIKYIEAIPAHKIGGGLEGTMAFTMDKATQEKVLAKCRQAGVKIVGYGVARRQDRRRMQSVIRIRQGHGD